MMGSVECDLKICFHHHLPKSFPIYLEYCKISYFLKKNIFRQSVTYALSILWISFIWFEDQTSQTGQGFSYRGGAKYLPEAKLWGNLMPWNLQVMHRMRCCWSRGKLICLIPVNTLVFWMNYSPSFYDHVQHWWNYGKRIVGVKSWYSCTLLTYKWSLMRVNIANFSQFMFLFLQEGTSIPLLDYLDNSRYLYVVVIMFRNQFASNLY